MSEGKDFITYGFELEVECDRRMAAEAFAEFFPSKVPRFGGRHVPGAVEHAPGLTLGVDRSIGRVLSQDLEVRSPPFPDVATTVAGFETIVRILRNCGARTRPTCGLHLHARVPGVTDRVIRTFDECWPDPSGGIPELPPHPVVMRPIFEVRRRRDFLVAVAVIEAWLPVQDRFFDLAYPQGSRGPEAARLAYARPLDADDVRFWARQCPNGFANAVPLGKRNRALNLCAVHKHGTLECRLFPATLDPQRFEAFMALWSSWCASLDPAALEARVPDLAHHADQAALE